MSDRLEIASRIIAGFAANPSVFAHNPQCGWSLVNATEDQISAYAVRLADVLIEAEAAIRAAARPDAQSPSTPPAAAPQSAP